MAPRPEGLGPPQRGLAGQPRPGLPSTLRASARRLQGRRAAHIAPGARRHGLGVLNVVSYNVNGLGAGSTPRHSVTASGACPLSKGEQLRRFLRDLRADVALLQEIHADAALLSTLEGVLKDWVCFWAPSKSPRSETAGGNRGQVSAGVAVLIRKRALIQHGGCVRMRSGSFTPGRDGRLASLHLDWLGHSLHVASAYLPNEPVAQRKFIRDRLGSLAASEAANTRTCVWGGDFNFAADVTLDRITDGVAAACTHPDASTAAEWAHSVPHLVDTFRARHRQRREFTYFHHRGASRLDRLYVSTHGLPYVVKAGVASRRDASGSSFLSDHRPVTMTLLHRSPRHAPRPRTGRGRTLEPRVHTEFLRDAALEEQYNAQVAALASAAPSDSAALLQWWPQFKVEVAKIARALNSQHRHNCAQRVAEAEAVVEEMQGRMAAGDAAAGGELRQARQAARQADSAATRSLHERHLWLHRRELPSPGLTARLRPPMDAACGPSLRTHGGHLVSTPGACAEVMVTHCAAISAQPVIDSAAREEVLAALDSHVQLAEGAGGGTEVDEAEVRAALRKARPTQPGLDGLKAVLYRAAKDTFVPLLARLFSAIGAAGQLPSGFHTGVIVPLHKGGDRTLAAQYRPITLLNTDYRLLAALLGARLEPHMPDVIDPVQTAFLHDRSIGENLWFLQMLPHALAAAGRSGVIALCDFKKAYDTVDRGFLLEVMRRLGVSEALLMWVGLLLRDTKASALVMGQVSRLASFEAGVRQGCPLAPLLYLFVGQALLRFLHHRGFGLDLPSGPVLSPLPPGRAAGPPGLSLPSLSPLDIPLGPASPASPSLNRVTGLQYADDLEAFLPSFDEVPSFVAAMDTFGAASGQRLSMDKTQLLEVGAVGPLHPAPVHGIKVVAEAKALGVTLHRGTASPDAPWDELRQGVERCYGRVAGVGLSAFGRGFSSAAYGVSRLLHAAEYAGLPAAAAGALQVATAALVDRNEAPAVAPHLLLRDGRRSRGFPGVQRDLLCGHPVTGGMGALPLAAHVQARAAKWGLRLLLTGTDKPWTNLAWGLLGAALTRPSDAALIASHLCFAQQQQSRLDWLQLPLAGLPPPLRRLLAAVKELPTLSRRVLGADGRVQLAQDWLTVHGLFLWRLHRPPAYTDHMLSLGAPAWQRGPLLPAAPAGTTLWEYSVRLGTRMFNAPAVKERAQRFQRFVEEVGGDLPTAAAAQAAMHSVLRALWRLPLPNKLKQPFWYCFLDALPTAERMHKRQRCGCGAGESSPGRLHHFAQCAVAEAVVAAITAGLPERQGANLLAELRAVSAPPGVHVGVWRIVALAACAAMDAGRRRLWHRVHADKARPGPALADEVSSFAVDELWAFMSAASRAPLPMSWRKGAALPHPLLGWDAETERWVVPLPAIP